VDITPTHARDMLTKRNLDELRAAVNRMSL
jgi:hypothetical protein